LATEERPPIRIAAYADVHAYDELRGRLRDELAPVNEAADVLVLAGDLTLNGKRDEAEILASELRAITIPIIGVLGNHDFELDQQEDIRRILTAAGVTMLDGETTTIPCRNQRLGFVGAKGFCGGFGSRLVAPFGERALKAFVRVGQAEAEKLECGLRHLRTVDVVDRVIAVVHYAPIRETVMGEPPELWPYLGNSSLAGPIDRHSADVVFHGHAHYGSPFGRTEGGVPVYNVARPLVREVVIHELDSRAA
jgi:Icc-related predicted phosphoesterase